MRRCTLVVICCAALLPACHESTPTEPDHAAPRLSISCVPTGRDISCSAWLYDVPSVGSSRDVTLTAVWLATDSSLGSYTMPGLFSPTGRGEVGLWARFDQYEASPPAWFLVAPDRDAGRLYWLSGFVIDDQTGEGIPGAEVRVLSGYAEGLTTTSAANGSYHLEKILTGETFSAVASKAGYDPTTKTTSVDPPVGGAGGNPPFLDFRLRRAAAPSGS